jgi:hypothetical protein
MAIVYNFIALGIIADFDNYIFESYQEKLKCLFELDADDEQLLIVKHTTSSQCAATELSKVKD